MWDLKIIDGKILLDGKAVPSIKHFNIVSSAEGSGIAELTIRMDVVIGCHEERTESA